MRKLLTLVTLCVLCGIDGFAQNTETKDITPLGFSGNFEFLQFSQTRGLLALSNKSVLYVSADTAKTWQAEKLPLDTINYFVMHSDGLVGFIKNKNTVYRTTDGSLSWEQMPLEGISKKIDGYEVVLERIHFKTRDTLFLVLTNKVNGKRIYKSCDCGVSWKEVAKDIQPRYTLLSGFLNNIHWRNENEGYFYGQGQFVKTIDGGDSWTMVNYSDAEYEKINWLMCSYKNGTAIIAEQQNSTNRLFFSKDGNPQNRENVLLLNIGEKIQEVNGVLYAVQGDYLWQSIDSAKTWNSTLIKEGANITSQGMYFYDNNVGVTISKNLTSYVTTDGGETWKKYVHGGGEGFSRSYDGLYVKSEKEVFVGGNTGRLLHSSDGGKTWNWQDIYTNSLHGIVFPSKDTGYIVSNKGILKTIDGGKSWIVNTTKGDYSYIDFPTNDCGYLGYSVNTPALYKTSNGGTSVKPMYTAVYGDNKTGLEPFSFMTEKKGLVCADNGNMLYTADGGKTWELKNTGFGDNELMESIVFVGKQGWLLNTLNEETTKIYYIDTLFNVSTIHEFEEEEGKGYDLKKVNDSLFYISMYKNGEGTLYFGNLIEWHKTSIPVKSATYAYNEHVVYAYDANTTTIYKTIVYDDSLQVSLQKESSYKYTLFSNVQNVLLNLSLTNSTGEIIWSGRIISENGETTIDFPETIEQGSYLLKIEPEQGYYYKTTEPIEVILKADDTPITEVSQEKSYTLYGKILYVYDTNAKLYSALGIEIPVQHGYIELKAGVYILVNGNETYKIVIQ